MSSLLVQDSLCIMVVHWRMTLASVLYFQASILKICELIYQDWLEVIFLPGLMYLIGLMWNHASPSLCDLSLCRSDSILVMWNEPLSRREKSSLTTNSMVITALKTTAREEGLSRQTEQSEVSTLCGLTWMAVCSSCSVHVRQGQKP